MVHGYPYAMTSDLIVFSSTNVYKEGTQVAGVIANKATELHEVSLALEASFSS